MKALQLSREEYVKLIGFFELVKLSKQQDTINNR